MGVNAVKSLAQGLAGRGLHHVSFLFFIQRDSYLVSLSVVLRPGSWLETGTLGIIPDPLHPNLHFNKISRCFCTTQI